MSATTCAAKFCELAADVEADGATTDPDSLPATGGIRRPWRVVVCGVGAAAGAAALAAAALTRPASQAGAQAVAATGALSLAEQAPAPAPVCAGEGQNCLSSKCCWDGGKNGLQCYAKDDYWAACAPSCQKGVHPNETHGTYDQWGQFHLDEWSCKELGERSKPGCETYASSKHCPSDRCMWKGSCLPACHNFGNPEGCATIDKCMWKDTCMEACDTFSSQKTCKPVDKCVWKNDKCQEGCWTFGQDVCSKTDRCVWAGTECKDNCWTYYSEGECGDHDRCMWSQGKCKPACSTFATKQSCPGENGCIWETQETGATLCMPDPCAAPGEDCSQSKCCSSQRGAAGLSCFTKDKAYATCMPSCGGDDKKDWACKQLGNRSRFEPGCAWAGSSCAKDQLCCNNGFSCVQKDDTFVGCVMTKKVSTWIAMDVPLPQGWKGTFVGGGRTEYGVPAAAEGEAVAGTSLYCFMAILPGSQEETLMKLAKKNTASIFACDASDVFNSWQSSKSGWDTGEATLTNTDVFINVWEQVHKQGKYMSFEWTVKVDADAVLVPARLKQHIEALRPPANRAIYVKNNAMDKGLGNNGFLGAVEVFSKVAMQVYYDNMDGCRTTMGTNSGEDGFFKACMDAIGVGFMTDGNLFNPDLSPGACATESRAAFHPLKRPQDWQCCVDILSGHPHNVVYGRCDLGYALEV